MLDATKTENIFRVLCVFRRLCAVSHKHYIFYRCLIRNIRVRNFTIEFVQVEDMDKHHSIAWRIKRKKWQRYGECMAIQHINPIPWICIILYHCMNKFILFFFFSFILSCPLCRMRRAMWKWTKAQMYYCISLWWIRLSLKSDSS